MGQRAVEAHKRESFGVNLTKRNKNHPTLDIRG